MQTNRITNLASALLSFLITLDCVGAAESDKPAERALMKDGKMFAVQEGKTEEMKKNVLLPNDIRVSTNGTFTVKSGKTRQLADGQVLDSEGMLTSSDGSVVPVIDHIAMKNGRLLIVRDGDSSPVDREIALPDGSKILPDQSIRTPDGRLKRLIDGDLLKIDGQPLPATDTISLQNGKVVVQKDGSLLNLRPEQTMMMNDGTKAFGTGTVIMKDGSTVTLTEGQIVKVEGVIKK